MWIISSPPKFLLEVLMLNDDGDSRIPNMYAAHVILETRLEPDCQPAILASHAS